MITGSAVVLHCDKAHVQSQWERANFDPHLTLNYGSDVIKTFFKTKTLISRPRLRPSLVFKTKTNALHLKTKTKTFL